MEQITALDFKIKEMAARIRELREIQNLTTAQMAEKTGVTESEYIECENGKKDLTEVYEILIRDVSSSLSVVFLVPMLTRVCVNLYEKPSGFVLMNKDRSKTGVKKVLDLSSS